MESSESEKEMFQETPRKNVRCSKKLTKERFNFLEANGFIEELITIVADKGWDRVDIEKHRKAVTFIYCGKYSTLLFQHINWSLY